MDGGGDTIGSIQSRLMKGDSNILPSNSSEFSALTGDTMESKEKVYAAEGPKKAASQYVGTITDLNKNQEK